jgi:twinkle protein
LLHTGYSGKTEHNGSKFVKHIPCESCGSSDACALFDDGHMFCFSCRQYFKGDKAYTEETNMPLDTVSYQQPTAKGHVSAITDRGITKDTAEKYGVRIQQNADGDVVKHYYPYFDVNNSLVAYKIRDVATKNFTADPPGSMSAGVLFGQHLCQEGGKYVTICEGELDAMAAYQMLGSKYAAVSIKDGAAAAVKSCKRSYDFLNSFNNIVICFDSDEVGQKAAREVAQLFEPNKCKIVALDGKLKDASGYLTDGKAQDFTQAWWAARTYTPAGIINLKDIGPELYEEGNQTTCLYPWDGINQKLYGIRTGELVTLTAGTGTGKSSVMRELMHHVLKQAEGNIGVISLEENTRSTIFHLMSVEANARLYIREVRENFPDAELFKWQEATIGTGRFYAFDHFGSMGTEEILARVRYMVKALDCKWIFLDHLSILVSGLEGMDERRNIDILMTKLRSLVEETNCALLLVSHLRRTGADSGHEDGKEVSLSHLRGSQSIAQLSDTVVAMERDQQSDDPNISNTTTIRVLKNRYAGETGVACHLFFNKDTGRLHEVTNLGDDLDGGSDDNDTPF